jgi:tight adherence protein C
LSVVGDWIAPKAEEKKSAVLLRLEQAGYRSPQAFAVFFGIKLLAFVAVPLLLVGGTVFFAPGAVFDRLWLIILSGAVAFSLPDLWLSRAVRRRQKHLRHGLPDALDLMVVCAEAGLGLNAAIKRVADDIGVQHPELADELQLVMMQTRAGMDSRAALKELERRTGLDDIKAFVTTLLQAMRFGTSISDSLRVFAEDMRDKRLQRAQEIAARLSLTMLMPIALCMLPMFLLIALGPSVLVLSKSVSAITGGD